MDVAIFRIAGIQDIYNKKWRLLMKTKVEYDAVIFDMDGVIFDSERAVMECWKRVAKIHKIEKIEEAVLACTGTTMKKTKEIMLERYGKEFTYDTYAKEASVLFHQKYDGGRLPVKKGVVLLLTFLKEEGKKIALASSTRKQSVMSELSEAGLLEYFDAIICGDMVEKSKPEPDIFLKACDALEVLPEKSYGIEDSYNGIRALAAGHLHPIMVPDLREPTEEIKQLAETVQKDLIKVKEYLQQCN